MTKAKDYSMLRVFGGNGTRCGLAALAVAATAAATPASALVNRAWVKSTGVDNASCGTEAAPCRTLQYTHNSIVAAKGEIYVADSAEYGPLTIRKSISVIGNGTVPELRGTVSGASVTITAAAGDRIFLRGLMLEGSGYGQSGVIVNSAGALEIVDSVLHGFTSDAIKLWSFTGSFHFLIADTRIIGNNGPALNATAAYSGTKGLLRNVTVADGPTGVKLLGGPLPSGADFDLTIVDGSFSNTGVAVDLTSSQSPVRVTVRGSAFTDLGVGVSISGASARGAVSRAVMTTCSAGLSNSGGALDSYNDNQITCNAPTSGSIGTLGNH